MDPLKAPQRSRRISKRVARIQHRRRLLQNISVCKGCKAGEYFDKLPLHLFAKVFEFLNGDSWGAWCKIASVCRAFHRWHVGMRVEHLKVEYRQRTHMNDRRLGIINSQSPNPLRTLALKYCRNITDKGLVTLSPLLKGLNLFECNKITDAGVRSLSSLVGLRDLNLTGCSNITGVGVASLSSLTRLQTLNLSHCVEIADAGLASLQSLIRLRALNLSYCKKTTDVGLSCLSSLTELRALNLQSCNEITDAGLASISSLTGLQTLDLGYCTNITIPGLRALCRGCGLLKTVGLDGWAKAQ